MRRLHDTVQRVNELLAYDLRANHIKLVQDRPGLPPLMITRTRYGLPAEPREQRDARAADLNTKDGVITVRTRRIDSKARVSIIDNGPGIKPDILPKIFDPFFTTKPVGKGTGLGLSVCYGIIKEHGGAMWAESEFGRGASFHVELPMTPLEGGTTSAPAPESEKPRNLRILVVDDEPSILKFVTKILSDQNTVVTADDGRAAIGTLDKRTSTSSSSDIRMPEVAARTSTSTSSARSRMLKRIMYTTGDILGGDEQLHQEASVPILEKPFSSARRALIGALLTRSPAPAEGNILLFL
jgi:two-component system NtrC family sensor kinase